jgi:hypothetical protein
MSDAEVRKAKHEYLRLHETAKNKNDRECYGMVAIALAAVLGENLYD